MKKIFTLSALALAALSAQAEYTFVDAPRQMTINKYEQAAIQKQAPAMFTQQQAKRAKAEDTARIDAFVGDWVMSEWVIDVNSEYDYIASNVDIAITDNGDGTATISNVFGYGDITATYNAETGSLEAPAQLLFTHASYGDINLMPFYVDDNDEVQIESEGTISFSLDSENRFYIDNDGICMVLTSGVYAGYILGDFYMYNQFDRVNGTMSHIDYYGDLHEYGIAWDGAAEEGTVYIYGFGMIGCPTINVDVEAGTATMEDGQAMFYYNGYGYFNTIGLINQGGSYYLNEDGMTKGTYEAETNTIKLNLFGLGTESGTLYDLYDQATIVGPTTEPIVGIATVENKKNDTTTYDLQGRVANELVKGQLYMQQNQKFVVK